MICRMLNLSHNHTILKDKLGSPALLTQGQFLLPTLAPSAVAFVVVGLCSLMLLCLFTITYSVLSAVYGPLRGSVRAWMCYLPSELMHSLS